MEFYHKPIMLKEITEGLNLKPSAIFVDCTIGGAGHSSEIAKIIKKGKLIGIDKDSEAISYSDEKLKSVGCKNFSLIKSDFKNFHKIILDLNVGKVDAILVDLGVSSHQIDSAERGFSFLKDGQLDMRMDKEQELSAFDVVNSYSKEKLLKILWEYGEERYARAIVDGIINARKQKQIQTTLELKQIIENSLPKKIVYKSGGAEKKTFQAIRIEVNSELAGLEIALNEMIDALNVGGRIAVLSFHSLEDRIVKNVFRQHATNCICPPDIPVCICKHKADIKVINKKPIIAGKQEQKENSRSTSAKLRIAEKI